MCMDMIYELTFKAFSFVNKDSSDTYQTAWRKFLYSQNKSRHACTAITDMSYPVLGVTIILSKLIHEVIKRTILVVTRIMGATPAMT